MIACSRQWLAEVVVHFSADIRWLSLWLRRIRQVALRDSDTNESKQHGQSCDDFLHYIPSRVSCASSALRTKKSFAEPDFAARPQNLEDGAGLVCSFERVSLPLPVFTY